MSNDLRSMEERIGPYRVDKRLGAGGMGEVYKAYDDRLDRWVAIKRIRADKDGDGEDSRERFQREARATAQLNHASIVHLYDIFRDGDSDCIVMEYVDGESLDGIISKGPLDPLKVAMLGHEIASGLAEAHAKGIIHRDLKVENIMITREGHSKILDFGLAKPLLRDELDTSLTGKGQLVGTSRAMSPEYVSGEEIDHRSDLFSLGVLLYEACTSYSPFKAHNTLATLKQVMLHHQTPAHQLNTQVPEDLSLLIERLLEKNPADRPQSAEEVVHEFEQIVNQLSSDGFEPPGSSVSTPRPAMPSEVFTSTATAIDLWSHRRWLSIGVFLVVLIGAAYAVGTWWVTREGTPTAPSEEVRIVIADFENRTGESVLDVSLDQAFRLGLAQSRHATVVSEEQMRNVLERMERDPRSPVTRELGREICQRLGVKALVTGGIVKVGDSYTVSAAIIDPVDGKSTFSLTRPASGQNEILRALDEVTSQVRANLGESLAAIQETSQPLEEVTTSNLEALKAYSLGMARNTAIADDEEVQVAIQLFNRALEIDPEFAMAHAKLAAIYLSKPHLDGAGKLAEHLNQADRFPDRLTDIERLYVRGWVARRRGPAREVFRVWSLMSDLHPEEFAGHFNLGMAYWLYGNRFEEAAEHLQEAARKADDGARDRVLSTLGSCQLALGRFDKALANFEKVSSPFRKAEIVEAHLAMENYDTVSELLESYPNQSPTNRFDSNVRRSQYHIDRGDLSTALDLVDEIERFARERSEIGTELSSQLLRAALLEQLGGGDYRRYVASATRGAETFFDMPYDRFDQVPVEFLAIVGKINARHGGTAEAKTLLTRTTALAQDDSLVLWRAYLLMLEGEILAAENRSREAIALLRRSLAVADTFYAHESLARAYALAGDEQGAIAEYQWLIDNRGRAFVECIEVGCLGLTLIDWNLSFFHIGQLYERMDMSEEAKDFYQRFLARWPEAREVPVWKTARSRLEALAR